MAEETRERISVLSGGTSPKTSTGTTRAAAKTDTKAVEKTSGILGRMFSKAKEAVSTATAAVFGPSKVTAAFNEIANQISNTNKLISLSVKNNREQNDVLKQVAEKIGKGNSFASGLSSLISSIGGLIGAMFSPIKAMIGGFVSWFMTSIVRKLAQWFVRRTIWAMGVKLAQFVGRNLWRLVARQIAPWLGRAALLTLTNPVAVAGGLLVGSAAILGTAIYQALTMSEEEKTAILEAANKQAATGRENMGITPGSRMAGGASNPGAAAARGTVNSRSPEQVRQENLLRSEADSELGYERRVRNHQEFAASVRSVAENVGQRIGVEPHIIIAHWSLETNNGRSFSGKNNLGNMTALRNQTATEGGDTDAQGKPIRQRFRNFNSLQEFGDAYASWVERRASSAIRIGPDAQGYFAALQRGGYATAPHFVSAGTSVSAQFSMIMPQQSNRAPTVIGEGGTPQPATPVPLAPSRGASLARTSTNLAAADERRTRTNSQSIVIVNNNTEQTPTQMASATVAEILHEDVPLSMRLRSVMSA